MEWCNEWSIYSNGTPMCLNLSFALCQVYIIVSMILLTLFVALSRLEMKKVGLSTHQNDPSDV